MKKHKGIWVVVGCLVLVFILSNVFSLFKAKPADTTTDVATTTQPVVVPLTFASSTKTMQTKEYGVAFNFPVTNVAVVNEHINTFVDATTDAFVEEVKGFGPLPVVDRQYTMQGWFEPHLGEQYNTFVFLVSVDTGGAHPNQVFYTKTFTPAGELATLEQAVADVYGDTITLGQIASAARSILNTQLGDDAVFGWIDDGTKPEAEYFSDFYIENNEMVFLFEPYAIGPYAWGPTFVRIPLDAFSVSPQSAATTTTATTTTATTTSPTVSTTTEATAEVTVTP